MKGGEEGEPMNIIIKLEQYTMKSVLPFFRFNQPPSMKLLGGKLKQK